MERKAYEVDLVDGKFFYKQTGELLHTAGDLDTKWIFVLSTSKTLYVGRKKKGTFQHSSFLAGGATTAAGRLIVENGTLKVHSYDIVAFVFFFHCYYISLSVLTTSLNVNILSHFNRQFGLTVVIIGQQNRTLRNSSHFLKKTMLISQMYR